jgi:pilus assembly protein Flp/PilA
MREGGIVMRSWYQAVLRFLKSEDGPTAVEYAVMLALIIVACVVAIGAIGKNANVIFHNVALNAAIGSSGS